LETEIKTTTTPRDSRIQRRLVTDKLRSYGEAYRATMPSFIPDNLRKPDNEPEIPGIAGGLSSGGNGA